MIRPILALLSLMPPSVALAQNPSATRFATAGTAPRGT